MRSKQSFRLTVAIEDFIGRRRELLLAVLLVLDGFALGGCLTSLIMRDLVARMMAVYKDPAQVLAVYNLFDHLIPYYLCYGGTLLALTVTTASVWLAARPVKA